jgi:hypothetical protein
MLNKKLQSLLEELTSKGEVAKKDNEATKENQPELYKVQLGNEDVYTKDSHKEVEEIKEVIVENYLYSEEELMDLFEELDLDTEKYNFEFLAEELGFVEATSKGEIAHKDNEATNEGKPDSKEPDTDNVDVYPSDEHEEDEEVKEVVVESTFSDEELLDLFEEMGLNTERYTIEYLAENLGFIRIPDTSLIESLLPTPLNESIGYNSEIVYLSDDELVELCEELGYDTYRYSLAYLAEQIGYINLDEGFFEKLGKGADKGITTVGKGVKKAGK